MVFIGGNATTMRFGDFPNTVAFSNAVDQAVDLFIQQVMR